MEQLSLFCPSVISDFSFISILPAYDVKVGDEFFYDCSSYSNVVFRRCRCVLICESHYSNIDPSLRRFVCLDERKHYVYLDQWNHKYFFVC